MRTNIKNRNSQGVDIIIYEFVKYGGNELVRYPDLPKNLKPLGFQRNEQQVLLFLSSKRDTIRTRQVI